MVKVKRLFRVNTLSFTLVAALLGTSTIIPPITKAHAASDPSNARITVDANATQGELFRADKYFNIAKQSTYAAAQAARPADILFLNNQGLHSNIQRVWINESEIYDEATGLFNKYDQIDNYLSQVSDMADELLVNLKAEKVIKELEYTPAQIKPIVKEYIKHIKQNYPKVKYLEVTNEPNAPANSEANYYRLDPVTKKQTTTNILSPANLYSYYKAFSDAAVEVNSELNPSVPLQVGGPALYNFDLTWFGGFLDGYKNDTSPTRKLDFVSYHGYLRIDPTTGKNLFYKNNLRMAEPERALLEAEFSSRGISTDIPSFITETGMYPGTLGDDLDLASLATGKAPKYDYIDKDQLRQAAGMASLAYWYSASSSKNVPFGWNVRHNGGNGRKDSLVSRDRNNKLLDPIYSDKFTPYGNMREMQSKMKTTKISASSDTMDSNGMGVYALAAKDDTGVSLMTWNYQGTGTTDYNASVHISNLPSIFSGKNIRVKTYKINHTTSNYYNGDPDNPNLQMVDDKIVAHNGSYSTSVYLDANGLQLLVLEPVDYSTLLNNTFNDEVTGALPSWTVSKPGGTGISVADVPGTVNRSVYMKDDSTVSYAQISKTFAVQTGAVSAEWRFMETQGLANDTFLLKSGNTVAVSVYADVYNHNLVANGSLVQKIYPNTWYSVNVVADSGTNTFAIFVDGSVKSWGLPFLTPTSNLDRLSFQTGAASSSMIYIDDVVVKTASPYDPGGESESSSGSGGRPGSSVSITTTSSASTPVPASTPTPATTGSSAPAPTPAPASAMVTDVKGHWAEASINKLVSLGAISGYEDGSFKPDHNITRAEFITILVQAFHLEKRAGKSFTDTASHWAKDYISAATAYGIVNGYNETAFGPDDQITREQMAVMICNLAKLSGAGGDSQFSDGSNLSSWAKAAVEAAQKNGIIEGYSDGSFKPQANATRAEAVVIIVKTLAYLSK